MSEELIKNKECRAAFDEARKNRFGVHRLDVVCEPDIFRAGYAAALRATHPAPESVGGVEEINVVGVRITTDGFGSYNVDSAMGVPAAMPGEVREQLMTVDQHQRIMAATVPAGSSVVPGELLQDLRDAANEAANEATRPQRVAYYADLVAQVDALLEVKP